MRSSASRHPTHLPALLFWLIFTTVFPMCARAEVASDAALRSIVLAQGAEYGTAFAFLNYRGTTYFLTAAHLIDQDAYLENLNAPDPSSAKGPGDWLAVYDPVDGRNYSGEIVGNPDFQRDLLVFKVAAMQHTPRALCLAQALPQNAPFAVASFTVPLLQNPPTNGPFFKQRIVVNGSSTTPALPGDIELQYAVPQIQGFSGAPLFDRESGAVIGIVRRVPLVPDPITGDLVASTNFGYGVTVDAARAYLQQLASTETALSEVHALEVSNRTLLVPRLGSNGVLRLIAFDDAREGNSLNFIYAGYDAAIRRILGRRFGKQSASALITPGTTTYPVFTPIPSISHICGPSGDAQGVVALRRERSGTGALRSLSGRIALVDCNGTIIQAQQVETVTMHANGPVGDEVSKYVAALGHALDKISGSEDQRLVNFADMGVPLSDRELRGFYAISRSGGQIRLSFSWDNGAAAVSTNIYNFTGSVISIDALRADTLASLKEADLDALLTREGGRVNATFDDSRTTVLRGGDICYYLTLRQQYRTGFPISQPYRKASFL